MSQRFDLARQFQGSADEIVASARRWQNEVISGAKDEVIQLADEGAEAMRERVHTAVTAWGSARQAGLVGGEARAHAGRIETGDMIGAIDSRVIEDSPSAIEVAWGWEDPEEYYLVQEYGYDEFDTKIMPMEALHISMDTVDDALPARIAKLGSV